MTLNELSVQFDLMYNNISSNQAPGLTEYEKSVFLTQAQEAVILELYKGIGGDAFESTEEVTRYLSSLVKSQGVEFTDSDDASSYQYSIFPNDVWFITYRSANIKVGNCNRDVIVVPTTQDDMFRELKNPFKGPNENRVIVYSERGKEVILSKYKLNKYHMKYLSRPYPIILEYLGDSELTINGKSESKEIDWVPESLHLTILLRAVQIAKSVWAS